ncbi:GntR family transcriptional regulator [Microbacterium thalassium]|uniref:GntR family transcriptional regulator n=1 Tax=Microbacterium TaxID=33882 RepID=UPI00146BE118|nr:GntR family transcriptional regulator [Microbacterium thalassium]
MTEEHTAGGDSGRREAGVLAGLTPRNPLGSTSSTRGRISDHVYDELREAIRDLRLEPGAPLSEPGVAAWLGVSRAPVREAFTRLADQRLIAIVPQVGSRVAPISMRNVADAVFIRSALEAEAFREAIRVSDLDTTRMQQAVDANRVAFERGDVAGSLASDEEIHQWVFRLAGVPHLWEVVQGLKVHLDRLRRLQLTMAMADPELPREHQQIHDALVARDEQAGVAVIHLHSHRAITDTERLRADFPAYFGA